MAQAQAIPTEWEVVQGTGSDIDRIAAECRKMVNRRAVAERRGTIDARLDEFRWLLEELRVSLFAQELRTPQPVSVKRLEKVWQQLSG